MAKIQYIDHLLQQGSCNVLLNGQTIGTAWLVSKDGYLLTAGHLLETEEALQIENDDTPSDVIIVQHEKEALQVKFNDDTPRDVIIVEYEFDEKKAIDFAVLKLVDTTFKRDPLPISIVREVEGKLRLYGYGETLTYGTTGIGEFAGIYNRNNRNRYSLFRIKSTELVDAGFSGGAVYSEILEAVVAIQIEAGKAKLGPTNETVLAMPLYRIAQYWPPLSNLAEKQNFHSEYKNNLIKVLDALSWAIRTLIAFCILMLIGAIIISGLIIILIDFFSFEPKSENLFERSLFLMVFPLSFCSHLIGKRSWPFFIRFIVVSLFIVIFLFVIGALIFGL